MTTRARRTGFTMIELMIGLAIAATLVVLALPSYSLWIADSQISGAAESIANGLRYTQGEAIRRNEAVEFIIDPTFGTGGWRARVVSSGSTLQQFHFSEGAGTVTLTTYDTGGVAGVATKVTFTGLAYIAAANADASPVLAEVRITSGIAGSRNLNVLVGGGASGVAGQGSRTGIKVCDPHWPATDPKGCPT